MMALFGHLIRSSVVSAIFPAQKFTYEGPAVRRCLISGNRGEAPAGAENRRRAWETTAMHRTATTLITLIHRTAIHRTAIHRTSM